MRILLTIALSIVLISGCSSRPDAPEREPQVSNAGTVEARASLDRFIAAIESEDGQDFAVKTSIDEEGHAKEFWVNGVAFDGDQFTGTVESDVEGITSLQAGQQWKVSQEEVLDWRYLRNGQVYGNYTEPTSDGNENRHP